MLGLSFLPIPVFQTHSNSKFAGFADITGKGSLPPKGRKQNPRFTKQKNSLLLLPFPQISYLPPNQNTVSR